MLTVERFRLSLEALLLARRCVGACSGSLRLVSFLENLVHVLPLISEPFDGVYLLRGFLGFSFLFRHALVEKLIPLPFYFKEPALIILCGVGILLFLPRSFLEHFNVLLGDNQLLKLCLKGGVVILTGVLTVHPYVLFNAFYPFL